MNIVHYGNVLPNYLKHYPNHALPVAAHCEHVGRTPSEGTYRSYVQLEKALGMDLADSVRTLIEE